MRRGSQVVAGRGYSKPPPGPMLQGGGGTGRVRLPTHDNVSFQKDRFGSPSLGNMLPISPPQLNREKSPNPTSQDLHDCSMCLSAYIQSLNTVCGTACRLSQCLAQVGAEQGCSDSEGNQFLLLLKEAAELWEGIARVVGVASTSVKNQMILLIQELQSRHNMEFTEQIRNQEVSKVVKLMLSTFLNLHCQFSLIIVEKFSGMLQQLKEDNVSSNGYFTEASFNHSPNVSPNRPSPTSPNQRMQSQTPYSMMNMSPQQLFQCQQQQQILLQQQQQQQYVLQQQLLQMAQQQHLSNISSKGTCFNDNSSLKEENLSGSRHSSGGGFSGNGSYSGLWPTGQGSPINTQQVSLSSSLNASHCSNNTLSPGLCSNISSASGATFGDWSTDSLSRRWSMGGPTDEGWQEKRNSLTPFTLMANRRWSVPETTEHEPNSSNDLNGLHPLYGSCSGHDSSNSVAEGQLNSSWGGSRNNHLPVSRESSCTRSPSHSRSITPEQCKRTNVITNEDIDDVISLLSLTISPSRKSSGSSSNSFDSVSPKIICSNLDHNKKSLKHQRIPEVGLESQSCIIEHPLNNNSSDTHILPLRTIASHSPIDKGRQSNFKNCPWSSSRIDSKKSKDGMENDGKEDAANQISTSLWPPTDSLPGVTLTECIGEEENEESNCWPDPSECINTECMNRDNINRESWPNTAFTRLSVMDDIGIGLTPSEQSQGLDKDWNNLPISTFRRHSTDAPYFLPMQNPLSLSFKTRSFENIAKVSELPNGKDSCLDSNIHRLLYLSSLNSSETTSANSQYTLFTTTT